MTIVFATLDAVTLGANLELRDGGMTVTCSATGAGLTSNARSTIGIASDSPYWETVAFGPGTLAAGNLAVGVVQASVANTVWPGQVAGSAGFKPADGSLWVNGVQVASISPASKNDVIGWAMNAAAGTLALRINGALLYTLNLGTAIWYPAASVGGTNAYDISLYTNLGRRAGENIPPAGYTLGIAAPAVTYPLMRIANDDLRLGANASDANAPYDGRIRKAENFYVEQGVTFWTDGKSGSSYSVSQLDLDNADAALDGYIFNPPRDTTFPLAIADLDNLNAEPRLVSTLLFDTAEQPDRDTLSIKLRDPQSRWTGPLQKRMIPPWADAGAANRPSPISLGACRNVAPTLIDGVNRIYVAHDAPLTQIGVARDMGDPLDPTANPADYTPTGDLRGIIPYNKPLGKFTIDISSTGSSSLTPTSPADLLGGIGAMSSASGAMPAGWNDVQRAPGHFATVSQAWVGDGGGRLRATIKNWQGQAYHMADFSTARAFIALTAGSRYRISLDVVAFQKTPALFSSSISLMLFDANGKQYFIAGAVWGSIAVGHLTADFTAPVSAAGIDLIAYIEVVGNTTSDTFVVDFDNITLVQLPSAPGTTDSLHGISLTDYVREILCARGGAAESDWVAADAAAIDADAPYPFGVHIEDSVNVLAGLAAPLDSFCATTTSDARGRIRIPRLRDPDTAGEGEIVFDFSPINLASMPLAAIDPAPGLTTKAGARHNWSVFSDSDFVGDFDPATGIDAATRARFKRDSQYIVASGVVLHPMYAFAQDVAEIPMLFDNPAHAQAELDRVCALFAKARINYTFTGYYDGDAPPILPGSIVRVTWPRGPLTPGKKLFVKRVRHYPFSRTLDITGWG